MRTFTEKSELERRNLRRLRESLPVNFSADDAKLEASTVNVSIGGVRVEIKKKDDLDALSGAGKLQIEITLPDPAPSINADCELAWKTDNQAGLRLVNVDDNARSVWRSFLDSKFEEQADRRRRLLDIKKPFSLSGRVFSDKEKRNLDILEIIAKKGPISKAEISRITGLNIVTVSNYVEEYLKEKLVIEKGLDVSQGGRRPVLLELNAKAAFAIGVDLGPEGLPEVTISAVIADLAGNVLNRVSAIRPLEKIDHTFYRSINLIQDLIDKTGVDRRKIAGVSFGISSICEETSGVIQSSLDSTSSTSYAPFLTMVEDHFGFPAIMSNDATLAALGEKNLYYSPDLGDMIYMYADVGLGLVLNGSVYPGASGGAGELTLNFNDDEIKKIDEDGSASKFLNPWGLDLGLIGDVAEFLDKNKDAETRLRDLAKDKKDNLKFDDVVQLAREGDQAAAGLIEKSAIRFGIKIAFLINLLNPNVVIIGGGPEKAGALLLDPVRRIVKKLILGRSAETVRILPSQLGRDSVCIGAAGLIIQEIFKSKLRLK